MSFTDQDAKALESRGFIPHTPATLRTEGETDRECEIVGYPFVLSGGASIFVAIYEEPMNPDTRTLVNVDRLTPLL